MHLRSGKAGQNRPQLQSQVLLEASKKPCCFRFLLAAFSPHLLSGDFESHKTENIDSLALFRKWLPTADIESEWKLYEVLDCGELGSFFFPGCEGNGIMRMDQSSELETRAIVLMGMRKLFGECLNQKQIQLWILCRVWTTCSLPHVMFLLKLGGWGGGRKQQPQGWQGKPYFPRTSWVYDEPVPLKETGKEQSRFWFQRNHERKPTSS